jgi:hypothetical protein
VAAGYGDYRCWGGLAPHDLLLAAAATGCEWVMLDTAIKQGQSLFDVMDLEELEAFVTAARQSGLRVALAGSLGLAHLPQLQQLRPDVVGVRGALCHHGCRSDEIDPERLSQFLASIRDLCLWTAN